MTADTYPTDGAFHVFARDLQTGVTKLLDLTPTGAPANGNASKGVVSPHGRYVAFVSTANDILDSDANNKADLFVRDLVTGTIRRPEELQQFSESSASASMPEFSADEKYLFFQTSTALVAADTNNTTDVYRYDLQTSALTLVTANPDGNAGNGASDQFRISADGRYVVFRSQASDLRSTLIPDSRTNQIYVRDLVAGTTTLVSATPSGAPGLAPPLGNGGSLFAVVSDDGRYVRPGGHRGG